MVPLPVPIPLRHSLEPLCSSEAPSLHVHLRAAADPRPVYVLRRAPPPHSSVLSPGLTAARVSAQLMARSKKAGPPCLGVGHVAGAQETFAERAGPAKARQSSLSPSPPLLHPFTQPCILGPARQLPFGAADSTPSLSVPQERHQSRVFNKLNQVRLPGPPAPAHPILGPHEGGSWCRGALSRELFLWGQVMSW